jgi:hypothetical protein
MKQITFIFLAVWIFIGSMAPNMQGIQLLKLPNLLGHVEEHFGVDWTISELKSFVFEHYLSKDLPPDSKHQNLPFKTNQISVSLMIYPFHPDLDFQADETIGDFSNSKPVIREDQSLLTRAVTIWIPPQLV